MAGGSSWTIILGALACLLVVHFVSRARRIPKGLRLPPGPPGKFLFGNASDMPTDHEWETYARWSKAYGDLVHVKVLNMRMIIVNSAEIAHELFEKRSSIYSDRFQSPMLYDLLDSGWLLIFMRYGERWRRHRKIFSQTFHPNSIVAYHDVQIKHAQKLLRNLHESPTNFIKHFRHFTGSIIMEITYGIQVLPEGDPYIQTAEDAMVAWIKAGLPGAFLVDTFPILKYVPEWMPGAGFQRKAREWKVPVTTLPVVPFEFVKKELAAGTAKPSILASLLEDLSTRSDAPPDEEEIIRNTLGVAYSGGADTTVSALTTFFLAMIINPEAQRKAQEEIDTVIGKNRLPHFDDRESLPYVNALIKEVHRWHPVGNLAAPHMVSEDDVYGDFFIPKGTVIVGNAWSMLHNEKAFGTEPDKFIPERFFQPGVQDPIFAFGFGRRICPGRYLAENTLFIAVASILQGFTITYAKDSSGKDIPVTLDVTSSVVSHSKPFQCAIKPRSASSERLFSER